MGDSVNRSSYLLSNYYWPVGSSLLPQWLVAGRPSAARAREAYRPGEEQYWRGFGEEETDCIGQIMMLEGVREESLVNN